MASIAGPLAGRENNTIKTALDLQTQREGPDFDGDGDKDDCDTDIDNYGVWNEDDVCDFTSLGFDVRPNGTVPADLDDECNVAQCNYANWRLQPTGP